MTTLWSRAEDVKEQFDYVTARAVGYADKLLPRVAPLVKSGGKLILYKQALSEEREVIFALEKRYNLWVVREHQYRLFEGDIERVLYVMEKG